MKTKREITDHREIRQNYCCSRRVLYVYLIWFCLVKSSFDIHMANVYNMFNAEIATITYIKMLKAEIPTIITIISGGSRISPGGRQLPGGGTNTRFCQIFPKTA